MRGRDHRGGLERRRHGLLARLEFALRPARAAALAGSALLAVVALPGARPARAQQPAGPVSFDPRLVFGGAVDARALARFEHAHAAPSGVYRSEIFVNGQFLDTRDVQLLEPAGRRHAEPCLDRSLLRQLDLAPAGLLPAARRWLDGTAPPACLLPRQVAAGLRATFSLSRLRVDIDAPEVLLVRRPRGWVPRQSWSDGVVGARLNYQFNAVHSQLATTSAGLDQLFLGLAGGVNLGAWQLRHSGTLSGTSGQGMHYATIASSLRHDVGALDGYVLLGQGQSDGQLLDSVQFRGAMLASEPRMQPASEQGYAPVIRGFAATASTVRVTQNGTLLYQTSVPAGAFAINDLYPPASGAPLQVTLTGLDGRVSSFAVPFSTLPQLQRPGHASYQLLAGQLQGNGNAGSRPMLLGSVLYGISNALTGELGGVVARGYSAQAVGAALNTRLGALALDVGASRFDQPLLGTQSGGRVRAMWNFARGGTGLSLGAVRQSSGYYGTQDVANLGAAGSGASPSPFAYGRVRRSLQLQLTQALGWRGSLYLSSSATRYWDLAQGQTTYQLGYVRSLGRVQLTVQLSRQLGSDGVSAHNALNVSVSLPLGSGPRSPSTSFGVQRASDSGTSAQWTLSGAADDEGAINYSVQAAAGAGSRSEGVSASWRTAAGSFGAAANQGTGLGQGARSMSLSANGGVVAFGGGVTFTPYLGDTIALIDAPGATGAPVVGGNGSRIDSHGLGVATYLTPYAADTVSLDTTDATSMERNSARVVPRAGAIVEVRLRALLGRWVLMACRRPGGAGLPFAAQVLDHALRPVGYVGQGSVIDVHLQHDQGRLLVRWGPGADASCEVDYRLDPRDNARPQWLHGASCVPPSAGAVR